MKKLYRKSTVHPTPPPVSTQLAFLPAAILALTVALGQEDKEVLAYLISCSSSTADRKSSSSAAVCGGGKGGPDGHPPCFDCCCFSCYISYWVRWDSSPNRQLIHEIIDAYEDGLVSQRKRAEKNKREKRKSSNRKNRVSGSSSSSSVCPSELMNSSELSSKRGESDESDSAEFHSTHSGNNCSGGEEEGGALKRFVSFIGERMWSSIWT
ncbi:unnamed protein product [Cuscuta epithymum]|uniref:Uncharacterized protein n=1 Tax=Cuscuta epithymum TaxID=186058 RepID=A0AAV0F5Z7_9ASTE|nr:unnamed protein product [Cuscuta epithymum]